MNTTSVSFFCVVILLTSKTSISSISEIKSSPDAKNNISTSNSMSDSSNKYSKIESGLVKNKQCTSTSGCSMPWHFCDNGICTCGRAILNDSLQCSDDYVSSNQCITVDQSSNVTYTGKCVYHFAISETLPIIPSELEDFMCGEQFNRTGTLCGKCKDGNSPLAYTFYMNCVECPDGKSNWWKYVLATYLPLTVFYIFVVLFKINITSSNIHGFVFCCQGLMLPGLVRAIIMITSGDFHYALKYAGLFFGIWNLDFLRFLNLNICLGTDTLQTMALDLGVGMYPLLLMILSYLLIHLYDNSFKPFVIIWKPFRKVLGYFRHTWEVRTSLIDAFATFFLLSNMKLLSVSFDLLAPVLVYKLNSSSGHITHSWRLYYDATIPYFGMRHLPYAIPAVVVLIFFVILPTLLLILYPFRWFQKFLGFFPFQYNNFLHTFIDTFQGCFKDGTEPGTRDCRWFAASFFILRLLLVLICASTLSFAYVPFAAMLLVLAALLLITIQPFKSTKAGHSHINAMFLLLLALCYVSLSGYEVVLVKQNKQSAPFVAFGALAGFSTLLYVSNIIFQWMYRHRRIVINFISAWMK